MAVSMQCGVAPLGLEERFEGSNGSARAGSRMRATVDGGCAATGGSAGAAPDSGPAPAWVRPPVDFLASRAEQLVHRLPAGELVKVYGVGISVPLCLLAGWWLGQSAPVGAVLLLILGTPLALGLTLWSARGRVLRLARRRPALWEELERLGLSGHLRIPPGYREDD